MDETGSAAAHVKPVRKLFEVRPNRALDSRGWVIFFFSIFLLSLSLSIRIFVLGYWLVLPFVLVDMGALVLFFLMLYRRSNIVEQVVVSEDKLEIFHLEKGRNKHWEFPLYWAQIKLEPPQYKWYPSRLLIGSHGKWVELASCLTDEERESLVNSIKGTVEKLKHNKES